MRFLISLAVLFAVVSRSDGQEARRRWERMCQIRAEKFDRILPEAMRENAIDMWIVMMREGQPDPLYHDLGEGYVGSTGYYIFTDRGEARIERAALGVGGPRLAGREARSLVRAVASASPVVVGVVLVSSDGF